MKSALLSVYDKTGIVDLAKRLVELDYRLISTGGTYKLLEENNAGNLHLEITDFPEILDGRVKTLHPRIHGGILARDERSISKS